MTNKDIDFLIKFKGEKQCGTNHDPLPLLADVCIQLLIKLEEYQIPKGEKGFNKCWLFQQLLFSINKDLEKKGKKLGLSYGWFRDGVVVDPESIMLQTRGKIKFIWEDDCPNCQIEEECPCKDNPWNDYYELIIEQIKSLDRNVEI